MVLRLEQLQRQFILKEGFLHIFAIMVWNLLIVNLKQNNLWQRSTDFLNQIEYKIIKFNLSQLNVNRCYGRARTTYFVCDIGLRGRVFSSSVCCSWRYTSIIVFKEF